VLVAARVSATPAAVFERMFDSIKDHRQKDPENLFVDKNFSLLGDHTAGPQLDRMGRLNGAGNRSLVPSRL
jgi:hypothetical protein